MARLRFAVQGSGRMATRMRALLGDVPEDRAEAVYIASRNGDHEARSIAALEAGKAVLCEKPFAMTPEEGERVIATARRTGRLYMEAVATPFLPAVAAAFAAVESGRIGQPLRLEASFGYPVSRATEPRLFGPSGGVLADRAVYPLMLALIALGPARLADVQVTRDAAGLDVAARFDLEHEGGARSELAVSFTQKLANSLTIEGDAGRVLVAPPLLSARRLSFRRSLFSPSLRQNPLIRRVGDLAARIGGGWHPYGRSLYLGEIAHFTALFRDGALESPVVSHERMLGVLRLIAAARAS